VERLPPFIGNGGDIERFDGSEAPRGQDDLWLCPRPGARWRGTGRRGFLRVVGAQVIND